MPKLILGDNPFFGVSHLDQQKSAEYLGMQKRFEAAAGVIRKAAALDIDLFMVSSHDDTHELLDLAGYNASGATLPDLCLLVPNVHQVNKSAAAGGLLHALKQVISEVKWYQVFSIRSWIKSVLLSKNDCPKVKWIGLHNVVTDLLLGLRAHFILSAFCWAVRLAGYRVVLVTLNPVRVIQAKVSCDALCFYYNKNGYNVCQDVQQLIEAYRQSEQRAGEIWLMGILASGVVQYSDLVDDPVIHLADRVLIATSREERLETLVATLSD